MKEHKFKQILGIIIQKNLLLTIFAFIVGLVLQLTEGALTLLVIGVAVVSTWWQWRPYLPNTESKLILDTLKKYPAVLVKNHPHIIAFNSKPPVLAAVYQSPVPHIILKRYLTKQMELIEGMELSVAQGGLHVFLLLKVHLTSYTHLKPVFYSFQSVLTTLEVQLQAKFHPAERYQVIRLFGLEKHLQKEVPSVIQLSQIRSNQALLPPCNQESQLKSEQGLKFSSLRPDINKKESSKNCENLESFNVASVGETVGNEDQVVFAKHLSAQECLNLSLAIKEQIRLFQDVETRKAQKLFRLAQFPKYYLFLFEIVSASKKSVLWVCVHECAIPRVMKLYAQIQLMLGLLVRGKRHVTYKELREILRATELLLKEPNSLKNLPTASIIPSLSPKKVGRLPLLLEN
ncbi:MAG: hypothetical protein ACFFC7_21710 [Candidatus Hermodarchaeota archaeon]